MPAHFNQWIIKYLNINFIRFSFIYFQITTKHEISISKYLSKSLLAFQE